MTEYDDVVRGMQMVENDGARAESLQLGVTDVQDLMADASFLSSVASTSSGSVGQIAGLEVNNVSEDSARVIVSDDNGFYIF